MDYIKLSTRLFSDVRFGRFMRMTGMDTASALGTLSLIHFAWAQTETDVLTEEDLEFAVSSKDSSKDSSRSPPRIAQAFVDSGLGERVHGGVRIKGAREALDAFLHGRAKSRKANHSRWCNCGNANACTGLRPSSKQSLEDSLRSPPRSPQGVPVEDSRVEDSRGSIAPAQPASEPGTALTKPKKAPSGEATDVAAWLLDAIRSHRPEHQARTQELVGWAREIDLAIRVDGASPSDLRLAIDWAHRNEADMFWRSNLLSGKSLRKHWKALCIRAAAPRKGGITARDLNTITEQLLEDDRRQKSMRLIGD